MTLKQKLATTLNEKDVENIYRGELNIENSKISSPFGIDGLLEIGDISTLLEFKYDQALKNKTSQCNILIQCIYYLKKFENAGYKLPSTIFVGDVNECFIIHTNSIIKYLSYDLDWQTAPSEAYKKNIDLIREMSEDEKISAFVYDIDENFTMNLIFDKIKDVSEHIVKKVRITKHNILPIFDYFDKNVLSNKVTLSTNERANLFIQVIINPAENYIHPKKKNTLISKSFGEVSINQNVFQSFFSNFEGDLYSPKEKEGMTTLVDRLIEDSARRKKGEFYTPTAWVDKAHEYISNAFGDDWKDKYIVWDCAWGTGNLTRDYKFKELYCSTLEQSDIDTANQMDYNPEATKFQFDFLNDDDSKLPATLLDAINNGKEILFLVNPPYATATNFGESSKADCAATKTQAQMKLDDWGKCSENLYAQFFYNIHKYQLINKNIKLCVFCPTLYLAGGSFSKFREILFKTFNFIKGFLFSAGHFSDTSSSWGINFAIYENKKATQVSEFTHDVIDVNDREELNVIATKTIYNLDTKIKASDWIRYEVKGLKTQDAPQLSSAIKVKQDGRGSLISGAAGYLYNNSNNVSKNAQGVGLFTSAYSGVGGLSIIHSNLLKCTNLFTARKVIKGNWINDKDEYMAPNEKHADYEQFTYDSLVYSLFNNGSNQSSLRKITYKGKQYDIKNEFFWMSKSDMLTLAEKNKYDNLYKDAKTSDERLIYTLLFKNGIYDKLSKDAKEVLDLATKLVEKSIASRKLMSEEHSEYHLDSWDAGYAQLKLVWKEYLKEDFNTFREKYEKLGQRLNPLVYKLGFLNK